MGLFFLGVGGVVCGQDIDDALGNCFDDGVSIGLFAERGVHFCVRVVGISIGEGAGLIGEGDVVGGCFGGDRLIFGLGACEYLYGAGGGEMLDVVSGVDIFVEADVSLDDDFFGHPWPTDEPEACGDGSIVHGGVFSEFGLLAVLHEGEVGVCAGLEDLLHDSGVLDDIAVVRDGDGSGLFAEVDLGDLLTSAGFGGGGDREDAAVGGLFDFEADPFHQFRGVKGGCCVGHAADGGEAAGHGCEGAGLNIFFRGLAGLAEVDMGVDEPWGCDEVCGVDDVGSGGLGEVLSDFGDSIVLDGDVCGPVEATGGVDDACVSDQCVHGGRIGGLGLACVRRRRGLAGIAGWRGCAYARSGQICPTRRGVAQLG